MLPLIVWKVPQIPHSPKDTFSLPVPWLWMLYATLILCPQPHIPWEFIHLTWHLHTGAISSLLYQEHNLMILMPLPPSTCLLLTFLVIQVSSPFTQLLKTKTSATDKHCCFCPPNTFSLFSHLFYFYVEGRVTERGKTSTHWNQHP